MSVWMYVCVRVDVCAYVLMYVCVRVDECACPCGLYVCPSYGSVSMNLYVFMSMYVCVCVNARVHPCVCVRVYIVPFLWRAFKDHLDGRASLRCMCRRGSVFAYVCLCLFMCA